MLLRRVRAVGLDVAHVVERVDRAREQAEREHRERRAQHVRRVRQVPREHQRRRDEQVLDPLVRPQRLDAARTRDVITREPASLRSCSSRPTSPTFVGDARVDVAVLGRADLAVRRVDEQLAAGLLYVPSSLSHSAYLLDDLVARPCP